MLQWYCAAVGFRAPIAVVHVVGTAGASRRGDAERPSGIAGLRRSPGSRDLVDRFADPPDGARLNPADTSADALTAPDTELSVGGPEVLTFRQCMERMLEVSRRTGCCCRSPGRWRAASDASANICQGSRSR